MLDTQMVSTDQGTDKHLSDFAGTTGTTLKALASGIAFAGGLAVAILIVAGLGSTESYGDAELTGPLFIASLVVALNTALLRSVRSLGTVVAQYIALRTKPLAAGAGPADRGPSEASADAHV